MFISAEAEAEAEAGKGMIGRGRELKGKLQKNTKKECEKTLFAANLIKQLPKLFSKALS